MLLPPLTPCHVCTQCPIRGCALKTFQRMLYPSLCAFIQNYPESAKSFPSKSFPSKGLPWREESQDYVSTSRSIQWWMHARSCPTFCHPMDCSLPVSSVHGFPSQEYLSGLPFPLPEDLLNPGIEPGSPAGSDSLPSHLGSQYNTILGK